MMSLLKEAKSKNWHSLVFVVVIWGFSPLLITKFSGIVQPFFAAAITLLVAGCVGITTLLIRCPKLVFSRSGWKDSCRNPRRMFGLAALGFLIYPVCFFTGLQLGQPVAATLLNYLWPLIAFGTAVVLAKRIPRLEEILGVLCAAFGALLIISLLLDPGEGGADTYSLKSAFRASLPYLLALVGAAVYGVFSGLVKAEGETTTGISKKGDVNRRIQRVVVMIWVAVLGNLIIWAFLMAFGIEPILKWETNKAIVLGVYGGLWFFGHFFWINAQEESEGHEPVAVVYLVPVFGVFNLMVFKDGRFDLLALLALAFVVNGAILTRSRSLRLSTRQIVLICLVSSWAVGEVVGRVSDWAPGFSLGDGEMRAAPLVQLLFTTFALFGGFVLANAVRRESETRAAYSRALDALRRAFPSTEKLDSLEFRKLLARLSWYSFSPGFGYSIDSSDSAFRRVLEKSTAVEADMGVDLSGFRSEVLGVEAARSLGISRLESGLLIWIASLATILLFIPGAGSSLMEVVRPLLITVLVLMLLAIRENNQLRPSNLLSFISSSQRALFEFGTSVVLLVPEPLCFRWRGDLTVVGKIQPFIVTEKSDTEKSEDLEESALEAVERSRKSARRWSEFGLWFLMLMLILHLIGRGFLVLESSPAS